jgi:hypothetical protein
MKRLWVLLCALLVLAGCASDSDRKQWDEALKDLRGDNMKMRSDFSAAK